MHIYIWFKYGYESIKPIPRSNKHTTEIMVYVVDETTSLGPYHVFFNIGGMALYPIKSSQ